MNIPQWDLTTIWKSFDDKEHLNSIADLEKQIETLKQLLINMSTLSDFKNKLSDFIQIENSTGALYESLSAYAYSMYATNSTNSKALNNISLMDKIGLDLNDVELKFQKLIVENKNNLSDFLSSSPNYKFIFDEEIVSFSHQMTLAEETLAADLQRFGGNAWSTLHEQIISNLVDKESGKTFNELRNDAYSSDRNVRKLSYYKEIELLKQNQIPIAAALNNIKGATVSLNKKRNWKQAIDKSLFSSRLSKKSLDALIASIEDSIPMWREYLLTKAKILDIKDDNNKPSKCQFYDIFAPVSNVDKNWTFKEAEDFIIKMFYSFSDDMGSFVENAFSEKWVDAEIRKGKLGGAFCIDFPKQKVSRVLSNFTGTTSDVLTLAHELGHAYHYHCIKHVDYSLASYPMTLAETASIFSETMVTKQMLKIANKEEKIKLLEMHLSDSCQTLMDILSRYYFERSVFEQRESQELDAEDFCSLMLKAQNDTYGDGIGEIKHPYLWAVKTHYYSPDLDFYNFPYAFGQLFASGLYSSYLKNPIEFPKTYSLLLADTGCMSCEDVCKKAGFDITTKDFWKEGIKLLSEELKELQSLI